MLLSIHNYGTRSATGSRPSKRTRASDSESSPPKKSRKGSTTTVPGINVGEDGAIIPYYPDEDGSSSSLRRSIPSTPSKSTPAKASQQSTSSYASHVPRRHVPHAHTSPAKVSTKTSHSYISSTYLSSTANDGPQLETQSSNLPAPEKFEAMLDELFDLNKERMGHMNHDEEESDEEGDDSDDERRRKKKKAKAKNKMNGGDSASAIFDITLSGSTLNTLVALTAKLKRNGQTSAMSASKLSSLLTILTQQLAVQSAGLKDKRRRSSVEEKDGSDDDDEDTNITTSTSMMHKFEACCDCCLVALHILSSKGMCYNSAVVPVN